MTVELCPSINFIIITQGKDSIQDKYSVALGKKGCESVFNYYLKERFKAKYVVVFYTLVTSYQG